MSVKNELDLCILFFYHKCDELTLRHYQSLLDSNPGARVLPLTNSVSEYLPGSIDVAEFASEWAVSQPWRNIDVTLYSWFLHRTFSAQRYLLIEYDCFCNVNLKEHYAAVWDADVAGVDYFTPNRNPRWEWFKQSELQRLSAEDSRHAAGVVPFVGMMFSHAALEKIVKTVSRDDLFCELRLGTAIRKLGLNFKRLPLRARATICWHPYPFQINKPGLFHGIKTLAHNSGKERQPGRIGSLFYDLRRSFNRQRILKHNRPQQ
jgi:hypothetical protein